MQKKYKYIIDKSPMQVKLRAIVYSKMILNGWVTVRVKMDFESETDAKTWAEELIHDIKNGHCKDYFCGYPTYTLREALKSAWWNIRWKYFNCWHYENPSKTYCEHFIPLKKKWFCKWPTIGFYKKTELTNSLCHKWYERLQYKLFGGCVKYFSPSSGLLPHTRVSPIFALHAYRIGWKDKYNTPRFENHPQFSVWLLRLVNFGYILVPDFEKYCPEIPKDRYWFEYDNYWEQALWCMEYCDNDLDKARKTWPWQNYETEESSWKECYILKKNASH